MNTHDRFNETWRAFLSESLLTEPESRTQIKNWAEKFFVWLDDSGRLSHKE